MVGVELRAPDHAAWIRGKCNGHLHKRALCAPSHNCAVGTLSTWHTGGYPGGVVAAGAAVSCGGGGSAAWIGRLLFLFGGGSGLGGAVGLSATNSGLG
jgi:hypothetical protein